MVSIGVVGAGIAGLHLGLALRAADVAVTVYTEQSFEDLAGGPLVNTVAHHHPLLDRERGLGITPELRTAYRAHHYHAAGSDFTGRAARPSAAVDHRLHLPRLAAELAERGGRIEVRRVGPRDLNGLAARHDLLTIATGRGALSGLFPRVPQHSPHDLPSRTIRAGLFTGVVPPEPAGVGISLAGEQGELLEIPILTRHGPVTALLFESPDALPELSPADDPILFRKTVLAMLEHHPATLDRVDPATFGLTHPSDLLQGALTPGVREDWLHLGDDRFALALGDAHIVVDPLMGQGANIASFSAAVVADAIIDDTAYDEWFCRRVARSREEILLAASRWTGAMLDPPPHFAGLFPALAADPALADEFTAGFAHPDRQWRRLATPRRLAAFLTGDRPMTTADR